ncbi:AT-rich interactive domain-containing protein 2 [Magnolia sinica]|uniref:AT-rich interactive domain-containing protein 2 n=1 Tax=Magnolia sinica TaxID=86752 RepID=UPI00265A3E5C|nr:AT-rich interactive domain-containing protein 2 [Magnolia sinica]
MRENQTEDQSNPAKNQIESSQSDGSSLDSVEILRNLEINGFGLDGSKDQTVRCLFDQILSLFLKEISQKEEIRPTPVMLGDGQTVDLFKLYWAVRQKGGYDFVTSNRQWGLVSEETGLATEMGSMVKLIYVKYLHALDQWLRMTFDQTVMPGRALSVGLEMEIKGFLCGATDWKMDGWELPERNMVRAVVSGNGHTGESINRLAARECIIVNDDDDYQAMVVDPTGVNGDTCSLRRKRGQECLSGMLNWVMRIAKNPGDPAMEKACEGSGRKAVGVKEYWAQVLVARKLLFSRRPACLRSEGFLLLKRQRMHPSMYEDYNGADSTENLRCSRRLLSFHKRSHSGSCSDTSTVPDNAFDKRLIPYDAGMDHDPNIRVLRTIGSLTTEAVVGLFCKDQLHKRVPVGPHFQAEVPDWTGMASEFSRHSSTDSDDSKWLGMQHWPAPDPRGKELIEKCPIGKGRPDSCGCILPGSVECVRFHVAEKRLQLKLELGSAFYNWKFDRMGEEISLSWREEEERRFKAIVLQNPASMDKNFWDVAYRSFRSRSRKSLVSYYFNVFLLRRRSYQNRVTPKNIDSDDEESEFGFVSDSLDHYAVEVFGAKSILCTQNRQCMDLEESMGIN